MVLLLRVYDFCYNSYMSDNTQKIISLALSLSWNPEGLQELTDLITRFSLWPELFLNCLKEKICGSFYYQCQKNNITHLFPEKYKQQFKKEYISINSHNIFQMDKLETILHLFEDKNISVLIVKGYSLLKNVYPTLGSKYPGDIDLVVEQKDLILVKTILNSSGYNSKILYPDVLEKKGFLPIDLKTDLISAERIKSRAFAAELPLADIFKSSLPWADGYNFSKIPSWEDHFLILCSHAEKHAYSKISLFYDLSRILHKRSGEIDLERLKTKAFTFNLQKPFYICLKYLQKRLFFPLENKLINDLEKTINFSCLELKIVKLILSGKKLHIAGTLLPVFSIKDFGGKLRFLGELVFPSKEVLRQTTGIQNPKLSWTMYPVRILQLTGEMFKALPKLMH